MKKQEIIEIYKESFEEYPPFDLKLFEFGMDYVEYLEEDGEVKSILFLLPCLLVREECEISAKYIFAAATKKSCRKMGYMEKLLDRVKRENEDFLFLRPANPDLINYYAKMGFETLKGIAGKEERVYIKPSPVLKDLSEGIPYKENEEFTLMYHWNKEISNDIGFIYSME